MNFTMKSRDAIFSCDGPWRRPEVRTVRAVQDSPKKNEEQVALIIEFGRIIRRDNLSGSHIHRAAMGGWYDGALSEPGMVKICVVFDT